MEFRYLGRSGLKISEITCGNWLAHGSQGENDVATPCVHTTLNVGISTFDTADVYANTAADEVFGAALKGQRRQSLEIFTKVYGPTGPKGHNDHGLPHKHILGTIIELERAQPVAWITRDLGTNRQDIQRIVNDLEPDGLLELHPQPPSPSCTPSRRHTERSEGLQAGDAAGDPLGEQHCRGPHQRGDHHGSSGAAQRAAPGGDLPLSR